MFLDLELFFETDTNILLFCEFFRDDCEDLYLILKIHSFVFVSSSAVHGPVLPTVLRSDSHYVSTGKAYGESKIAAEKLIRETFADVPSVIIRPTFVWGPRSHLFTTGPLAAMARGAFRLVNNGEGRCHAVYIDHLVESIFLAAACLFYSICPY